MSAALIIPELVEGLTIALLAISYSAIRKYLKRRKYQRNVKKWMALAECTRERGVSGFVGYEDVKSLKSRDIKVTKLDLETYNGWVSVNKRRPHPHDVDKFGELT